METIKTRSLTCGRPTGSLGNNAAALLPSAVSSETIAGHGAEVEIFRLTGDPEFPRVVTVAMQARGFSGASEGGALGPCVGIVEFGSGDAQPQRVEFDLPLNAVPLNNTQLIPSSSGCLLSFPASNAVIKARNDANFMPRVGDNTIGDVIAPFERNAVGVNASLAVGSRGGPPTAVYRTIYATFRADGAGLLAGTDVSIPIPPYARTVRILRNSAAQSIAVTLFGVPINIDGPYNFAANIPCSTLPLSGNMTSVNVANTGAGDIGVVAALYEIGL